MATRVEKLNMLKQFFLASLVEDPQDGTDFDCDVLDAIESLESRYSEEPADVATDSQE